jgi:alginate O-acetyltransferase complex protein AlgJ
MKTWTVWLSGSFAATILLLALAAGWRAAPAGGAAEAGAAAGWWDGAFTREFESHYDAVFPVRTLGINTWAAISYLLFREGKPGAVVGRDGWLYTSEEFTVAADAEAQVEAHLAQVAEARERLAARGAGLVIALVPAKARLYPEHVGTRQPAPLHGALYARALEATRAADIPAPDLLAELGRCKAGGPVFLRTDTHWTPAGAQCAAAALARHAAAAGLGARGERIAYRTTAAAATPHRGDLLKFLPLDPWFEGLLPAADTLAAPRTESPAAAGLLDEAPAPEVVLVGTSYSANPLWNFTGALQEAFGEDVVSYATPAQGPFLPMREYLDSADFKARAPRLVIWEMPERYLPMRDGAADAASAVPPKTGHST